MASYSTSDDPRLQAKLERSSNYTIYDLEQECLSQMARDGIHFPKTRLETDGILRRFSRDQCQDKEDEFYWCRSGVSQNGNPWLSCYYGTWSGGKKDYKYSSYRGDPKFSQMERETLAEEENQWNKIQERIQNAQLDWERASEEPIDTGHLDYLSKKMVERHGVKFSKSKLKERASVTGKEIWVEYPTLVIPIRNIEGRLQGVQHIFPSGEKRIHGLKKGNFHVIGSVGPTGSILIGEGYATVASVYEAIREPSVVTFDCGNFDPVIQNLKKMHPQHRIVIIGDDDAETERKNKENPGKLKAIAAAKKHRCKVIFPQFPEGFYLGGGSLPSDFNDLRVHFGMEEVKKQLMQGISQSKNAESSEEDSDGAFIIRRGGTHLAASRGSLLLSDPSNGIFQRAGQTVRIIKCPKWPQRKAGPIQRQNESLIIVQAQEIEIVRMLSEKALWKKFDARSNGYIRTDFPDKAAKMILSERGVNLPVLTGFVNSPTLRVDGSILEKPGYDLESGLFFDPCGAVFPPIPVYPTKDQAVENLLLLRDMVKDFPFENKVSESVAIAQIMTGAVRRSLPLSPVFGNSAPVMESGKTLLVDINAMLYTGKNAVCISPAKTEEENRKRLFSVLLAGDLIVCIDNVSEPFESDAMCTIVTSQYWQERLLGTNTKVEIPTNALFIFTGNNLVFRGDMSTRVLMCQIDPRCERPGERVFSRDLRKYVPENRGALACAAPTIIRAFIAAGSPDQGLPPYRLFSEWSHWIRSSLAWLDMPDPYQSSKIAADSDPIKKQLKVLFEISYAIIPLSFTAKELCVIANDPIRRESDKNVQALYDALLEFASDREGKISSIVLGNKIRQHKGRQINGYRLEAVGEDRGGAVLWKILKI